MALLESLYDPDREKLKSRRSSGKAKVLNKAPAPLQVTAEQILREALERQDEEAKAPVLRITDPEELASYQLRKRKEFEDVIRRQRMSTGIWMKYAAWEATQHEWERCRSIYERALDVDYRNHSVWLKYAEFEMKNRFVNHARNIWDRAVQLLPRVDQLWFKYSLMEETLGNMDLARAIFERWMKWHPGPNAWESYIKLEMRCSGRREQRLSRTRQIWLRYTRSHANVESFMKWAKFEEKHANIIKAREVYARALEELGKDAHIAKLFIAFAGLEQKAKEIDRSRVIYKFALDHIPKHLAADLYARYTAFEKQHGGRDSIDEVILSKRRFQYEEELKSNPRNYDVWFDYVKLEESNNNFERIRDVYERSISQLPPLKEKRYWRRYIYLWIRYAIFEELTAKDIDRARSVYAKCCEHIPHEEFTFAKVWLMRANLEIRAKDLTSARKILGESLGRCPKPKLYWGYIEIETKLLEIERCRKLYQKFLEFAPDNCLAWSSFAKLEESSGETARARQIFELAIEQQALDMPENIWKDYIDFEIKVEELDRAKDLYERLLERTKNVKVWRSYALFEAQRGAIDVARGIYEKADVHFRAEGDDGKLSRVDVIQSWKEFEIKHGTKESLEIVEKKTPKQVKKKKLLHDESGNATGWHEYVDFIFPDSAMQRSNLAILEAARKWKRRKLDEDEEMA
uniref:Crooked neck-like protein 1 n=1 Tax=Hirondellea gigas TaxID=1518452 RepID=A0A6A7G2M1_9CRUS